MGYKRVITYILSDENGASLRASNFVCEGKAGLLSQVGARQKVKTVAPQQYKQRFAFNFKEVKHEIRSGICKGHQKASER